MRPLPLLSRLLLLLLLPPMFFLLVYGLADKKVIEKNYHVKLVVVLIKHERAIVRDRREKKNAHRIHAEKEKVFSELADTVRCERIIFVKSKMYQQQRQQDLIATTIQDLQVRLSFAAIIYCSLIELSIGCE